MTMSLAIKPNLIPMLIKSFIKVDNLFLQM